MLLTHANACPAKRGNAYERARRARYIRTPPNGGCYQKFAPRVNVGVTNGGSSRHGNPASSCHSGTYGGAAPLSRCTSPTAFTDKMPSGGLQLWAISLTIAHQFLEKQESIYWDTCGIRCRICPWREAAHPPRRVDGAAPFTRLSLQKLHKCGNLSLL